MALTAKKLDEVRASVPVGEVTKDNQVRVNFNVPKAQRARWKTAAIAGNYHSLADMIIEAVEAHLNK